MIYLVFTEQGYEQAKPDIIEAKATLWINPNVLSKQQQDELTAKGIDYSTLREFTQPDNEAEVIKALQFVEEQSQGNTILVEFI